MSDKKLKSLLGFVAMALLLMVSSVVYGFILSALCAVMAILAAIAVITAMKTGVVATKTAMTGNLCVKEENKKVAAAGRIAALVIVFTCVGIMASIMLAAASIIGINENKKMTTKKETVVENKNVEGNETSKPAEVGVKEVCCQLISSALTDVNDNLLYGLGDGIGNYVHSLYNKIQPVFAQTPNRGVV